MIAKHFPGSAGSPFDRVSENKLPVMPIPLTRIGQLVQAADNEECPRILTNPDCENIFIVKGRWRLLMVSVRKHLNTWLMRKVDPGNRFRGEHVYLYY